MDLKRIYVKYGGVIRPILYCKNRLFGVKVKSSGRKNQISGIEKSRIRGTKIVMCGDNNIVEIGDMVTLYDVTISVVK